MLEKIAQILRDYKENQDLVVTESTTFEELELDSLETVDIVMNVEEEFGVEIELKGDIKTVADLIKVIEAKG